MIRVPRAFKQSSIVNRISTSHKQFVTVSEISIKAQLELSSNLQN